MKETIAVILIWVGATVMNISFWVWIISLLVWKFFAVVGASTIIYPSFYFLLGGIVTFVSGIVFGSILTNKLWLNCKREFNNNVIKVWVVIYVRIVTKTFWK